MDIETPTLGAGELRRRAVKSTVWFGATRVGVQVGSWAVTIVLARLLTPKDYGLFAMALSVLAFVEILQEFGLGAALIQRRHVSREQINGVFWVVVGASGLLTALLFVSADLVAAFYAEPGLSAVLRVLSLAFLLNSFGMVPLTLLTREIHLHRRSLAEAAGVILSIPVALYLAYVGYGVWALIMGHLARSLAMNIALAIFARWLPGLSVTFQGMGEILRFGLNVVGSRVVTNLSTAVNTAIVGRMLGGRAVGLYSMSRGLADGPHRISTSVINQISFPIFSRVQDDRAALTRYFLSISKYLGIICLPVQVGMALVAAELVPIVLSPTWSEIIGLLELFAVGAILVILTLPVTSLLQARGRPQVALHFVWFSSAAMAVALLVGASFGLTGVAVAWMAAMLPSRAVLLFLGLRELRLSLYDYSRHLMSPMLATVAMALSVFAVAGVLAGEVGPLAQLGTKIGVAASTYACVLLVLDRRIGADIKTIARDLFAEAKA